MNDDVNDRRRNWPAMRAIRLAANWAVWALESMRWAVVFQWEHESHKEGRSKTISLLIRDSRFQKCLPVGRKDADGEGTLLIERGAWRKRAEQLFAF